MDIASSSRLCCYKIGSCEKAACIEKFLTDDSKYQFCVGIEKIVSRNCRCSNLIQCTKHNPTRSRPRLIHGKRSIGTLLLLRECRLHIRRYLIQPFDANSTENQNRSIMMYPFIIINSMNIALSHFSDFQILPFFSFFLIL
jgi:hypothetical protein